MISTSTFSEIGNKKKLMALEFGVDLFFKPGYTWKAVCHLTCWWWQVDDNNNYFVDKLQSDWQSMPLFDYINKLQRWNMRWRYQQHYLQQDHVKSFLLPDDDFTPLCWRKIGKKLALENSSKVLMSGSLECQMTTSRRGPFN